LRSPGPGGKRSLMAPHPLADVRASWTIRRTMLRRNQLSCIT